MVERVLITTALEDTWPQYDTPVLFLGEWCKLYSSKDKWSKFDSIVVPYHWDDRAKLYEDYQYLTKLQEILLKETVLKLNEVHCINKEEKYWKILISPWLNYFLEVIFDRWVMIDYALKNYNISEVNTLMKDANNAIPFDFSNFNSNVHTDTWNDIIYGDILREIGSVPIKEIIRDEDIKGSSRIKGRVNLTSKIKGRLKTMVNWISSRLSSSDDFFLLATYLPIKYEMALQWSLGQVPKFWFEPEIQLNININSGLGRRLSVDSWKDRGFENFARKLVFKYMPIVYLEGYGSLLKTVKKASWPSAPKAIFTSNSIYANEVFKAWAAEKVCNGSPLIIGQHGGNYGASVINYSEDHEIEIADSFLSWGWDDPLKPNIIPMFNLKMVGKKSNWNPKGYLFLVTMSLPRYSYCLLSVPIASQFLNYLEDQCRFIEALSPSAKEKLLVRLFPKDNGWAQSDRYVEKFPWLKIDISKTSIFDRMRDIRLYVSTYNATTFLESLYLNIPTIMYWDFRFWEISQGAQPYYDQLISSGILHDSPESAARKVEEIWHDVELWWESQELQTARKHFCSKFSREVDEPIRLLKELF